MSAKFHGLWRIKTPKMPKNANISKKWRGTPKDKPETSPSAF